MITSVGDSVVCSFAGELDMDNEARVRHALDEALAQRPALVAVELSGVRLFTSSALNALLAARLAAMAHGIPIVLAAPRRMAQSVLEITQVDQVFPVYPALDQALRHSRGGGDGRAAPAVQSTAPGPVGRAAALTPDFATDPVGEFRQHIRVRGGARRVGAPVRARERHSALQEGQKGGDPAPSTCRTGPSISATFTAANRPWTRTRAWRSSEANQALAASSSLCRRSLPSHRPTFCGPRAGLEACAGAGAGSVHQTSEARHWYSAPPMCRTASPS
ncbi:STAS domain-containing protein [Kitasatospora sp. DSM 101779]|nr:STAS domain-containing protein [Kitasatospora sp. DSM 101779]